jgi:hypothetical protein
MDHDITARRQYAAMIEYHVPERLPSCFHFRGNP